MEHYEFIDPKKVPFVNLRSRGELPHLEKDGCTYFVTFRMFDAIRPRNERVKGNKDSQPDEIARFSEPVLQSGSCALREPQVASLVSKAILQGEGVRYQLRAWCVMPNHVHLVIRPCVGHTLRSIMKSLKSFTSRRANAVLRRKGTFWERESFDHVIRSAEGLEKLVWYTEQNPVSAGYCVSPELWPYSSASQRVQRETEGIGVSLSPRCADLEVCTTMPHRISGEE